MLLPVHFEVRSVTGSVHFGDRMSFTGVSYTYSLPRKEGRRCRQLVRGSGLLDSQGG